MKKCKRGNVGPRKIKAGTLCCQRVISRYCTEDEDWEDQRNYQLIQAGTQNLNNKSLLKNKIYSKTKIKIIKGVTRPAMSCTVMLLQVRKLLKKEKENCKNQWTIEVV